MTTTGRTRAPGAPTRASQSRKARRAAPRAIPERNLCESPIAWLFSRRDSDGNPLITEAQFNAGEKLRADFHFAQMSPHVTQSWSASSTGGGRRTAPGAGVALADNIIAAGERVHRALRAVGPELSGVLIDVCCYLKGLEEAERRAGWPQRSGKIVLGVALSALARHYGFVLPEPALTSRRIRHWGADDFRPTIDGDKGRAS